jgi:hypothetical protein
VEPHDVALDRHRGILLKAAEALRELGFRKKGHGLWKTSADGRRFAGFLARPVPRKYTGKRVEFSAITMGGWSELHETCFPKHLKPRPFGTGPEFAQFEHDMLTPKGDGFTAKLWTVWPSTDVEEFWPPFYARIVSDTLPAVETMFNRRALLAALERSAGSGPVYIRPIEYSLSSQIINTLSNSRDVAYS